MAKWIKDWTDAGGPHSIACREVHTTHSETYSALSGNPQYIARLAVPWSQVPLAISRLLGQPAVWPKQAIFTFPTSYPRVATAPVAVDAKVINDAAAYTTDVDGQVVNYITHGLIDVTYIARNGVYYMLTTGSINQPVYLDDTEEPRIDFIPLNYEKFCWGGSATPIVNPPNAEKKLLPGEAPVKSYPGQVLTHSLEGWCGVFDVGLYVSTVHTVDYASSVTRKIYPANTLMLRSYSVVKGHTFRSYRAIGDPVPSSTAYYDFAQTASGTLKMIYEYRPEGWNRFYHVNLDASFPSYDYMHFVKSPHNPYLPFPGLDHAVFFQGNQITLVP